MMLALPSTLSHLGSDDERSAAEFLSLLAPEEASAYLTETVETLESGRDPSAFWTKWIDVVIGRTPVPGIKGPPNRG
jgi:hypothetical protein